jgi:hypothetical protein
MMATAFLGYLNIALNGLNSKTTTKKNNTSRVPKNNSNPHPKIKSKILTEFIEQKNFKARFCL